MNSMKIFNLVYNFKKAKTVKSGVVDRILYLNIWYFNTIKFLKLLPSCKSVIPLRLNYHKWMLPETIWTKLFQYECPLEIASFHCSHASMVTSVDAGARFQTLQFARTTNQWNYNMQHKLKVSINTCIMLAQCLNLGTYIDPQ